MKFSRKYTAIPNQLIDNTVMHYTSKVLYCALAFMQRRNGRVKVTISQMVSLSGLCEKTVLQAIQELESCGFLRRKRNWRWSALTNAIVYASNTYKLSYDFSSGYTLISSAVMDIKTTPAGFSVLLFLYRCAGRTGRAFPSIRYISGAWKEKSGKGLEMSKSTVQRVLNQLERMQAFVKKLCEKRVGSLSCNSYYLTDMVPGKIASVYTGNMSQISIANFFVSCSVPIFSEPSISNKITRGLYFEEKEKGVGQFGVLYNFWEGFLWDQSFYFDGSGVKVFSDGEQDLTS